MSQLNKNIQLGCGLIRIGRPWGYKSENIPTNKEIQTFLHDAVNFGIRFFDTAPAYGTSEKRLGQFLKTVSPDIKKSLIIATKCGEFWNEKKQTTMVDHSYDALIQSIDTSLSLLEKIDILQIHKANPSVLQSKEVQKAMEYARSRGIKQLGASISDLETAKIVSKLNEFSIIQLPYNPERKEMKEALDILKAHGKYLIINRPFNMGGMIYKEHQKKSKQQLLLEAYTFILKENFNGIILTGTGNSNHLYENITAFNSAKSTL
ncbi:MAG TPA: aldo/keto reductase [Candidatus Saccharimonadales bacterium]|nr:aldo/keto reductase [Candidatus Saccharimonadales bacterium]